MKQDPKKKWRIKIIGILLCILLALLSVWILFLLSQHIVLLYAAGLASILFFYRTLFYQTPEQRKKQKIQKAEFRRWKSHRFYPVSNRARAAYLILCLEEALKFYGQDFAKWEWVLKKLWEITETDQMEEWALDVLDLLPDTVFSCKEFEELGSYRFSMERFTELRNLYQSVDRGFGVLEKLIDCILSLVAADWEDFETPPPSVLQFVEEAEWILKEKGIPLPHEESTIHFLLSQKDKHAGKPFDGLRFSALS